MACLCVVQESFPALSWKSRYDVPVTMDTDRLYHQLCVSGRVPLDDDVIDSVLSATWRSPVLESPHLHFMEL